MKQVNRSRRQSGFFDLGISLFVLAIAGGVVYGVETSHQQQAAAGQNLEIVQPEQDEVLVAKTGEPGTHQ